MQHTDGIKYMFDASETYRELVTVKDTLYIQPDPHSTGYLKRMYYVTAMYLI